MRKTILCTLGERSLVAARPVATLWGTLWSTLWGTLWGTLWVTLWVSLSGSVAQAEPAQGLGQSHDRFCAEVQQLLVPTELAIINRIEPDFEAFKLSKPQADPLTLHQFLAPAGPDGLRQLSCKTKSADHLRAVYGEAVADAPPSHSQPARSCRDVHRAMVRSIWQHMSAAEREAARYPPHRVMLQADLAYLTGSSWVQSPAQAYEGAEQRLYLRAVRLFAGWEDWRWKMLPESLRGNHYCHLIAPESLRSLMQEGLGSLERRP